MGKLYITPVKCAGVTVCCMNFLFAIIAVSLAWTTFEVTISSGNTTISSLGIWKFECMDEMKSITYFVIQAMQLFVIALSCLGAVFALITFKSPNNWPIVISVLCNSG